MAGAILPGAVRGVWEVRAWAARRPFEEGAQRGFHLGCRLVAWPPPATANANPIAHSGIPERTLGPYAALGAGREVNAHRLPFTSDEGLTISADATTTSTA